MMIDKNNQLKKGIALIVISSVMTCGGQLCWKLGAEFPKLMLLYYFVGFSLYGLGALLMMISFRFGEMSVLHPMMSVGFIGSLILGAFFLNEEVGVRKIAGVLLVLLGIYFLNRQDKKEVRVK